MISNVIVRGLNGLGIVVKEQRFYEFVMKKNQMKVPAAPHRRDLHRTPTSRRGIENHHK